MKQTTIGVEHKGFPPELWGSSPTDWGDGIPLSAFGTPLVTLDAGALEHNTQSMAAWAAERGVLLAPHGKTTMAPQLWRMLLDAGAWGLTLATGWQVQVAYANGVRRVQMPSPILDANLWRWVTAHPDLDIVVWADAVEAVETMAAHAVATPPTRPVRVLVERGGMGGRTGARTTRGALDVARAISDAPGLQLAGVAGYEGALAHDREPASVAAVTAYLDEMATLIESLDFDVRPLVTAGGSAYPDLVAERFAGLRDRADVILRSGAFQIHDDGFYAGISPLRDTLRSAMHGWARVVSTPEPHLALLDGGRRDFSFDEGLPVLQYVRGRGPASAAVTALNDQHAFLTQPAEPVSVGDVVRLGLSHPCTVLDKWRMIPVVDDAHAAMPRVINAIQTWF